MVHLLLLWTEDCNEKNPISLTSTLGQTLTLGAVLKKKKKKIITRRLKKNLLLTVKADFIVSENGMILQNSS